MHAAGRVSNWSEGVNEKADSRVRIPLNKKPKTGGPALGKGALALREPTPEPINNHKGKVFRTDEREGRPPFIYPNLTCGSSQSDATLLKQPSVSLRAQAPPLLTASCLWKSQPAATGEMKPSLLRSLALWGPGQHQQVAALERVRLEHTTRRYRFTLPCLELPK